MWFLNVITNYDEKMVQKAIKGFQEIFWSQTFCDCDFHQKLDCHKEMF